MSAPEVISRFAEWSGIFTLMTTKWAWPVCETVHFVGLSLLIGTVGLFDLRMLGLARGISIAALHRLVPFGICGYLLNLSTGILFFCSYPDQYLYNPAFQSKLIFMFVAGINVAVFYTSAFRQARLVGAGQEVSRRARLIALVSLCCWIGVITCGRLITFYRPPYFWCIWC